jgi:hypothetical protein
MRKRPRRGHKPVTIRECEVRAQASVPKFGKLALAPAGSCKRLFVGDTTFEPTGGVFVAKSFAIFAALD